MAIAAIPNPAIADTTNVKLVISLCLGCSSDF